jgi:3-deoxy-D-manno-octulosonic-acid transferase
MRIVYSFLILVGTPFVLLYFAIRGFRDRAYLSRWSERFGFFPVSGKPGGIWVHAASVGEFNAASPLIKAIAKEYPELPLTVTSLTPTGSERVQSELGKNVLHSYIPIDLPGAVSRFLERLQPSVIIIMETEIWPNLYLEAQRRNIPLLMANARLSGRSVRRYQAVSGFIGEVLQGVAWIGAQSDEDADRFLRCGADLQRIHMTGNLKFDQNIPASLVERGIALRSRWDQDRPVLVAGSTHEADENVLIPAFTSLLEILPDALLILVPRYPERFTRAAQLAKAAGLHTELRSQGEACSAQAQCFIIDSIGELLTYYACADVTFVGGSFGEQGGHNPLEPAALGKPVLLGPNMVNAKEISLQLLQCGAAKRVTDQYDFRQSAEKILTDGNLRHRMGMAGKGLVDKNRGALDLTLDAVKEIFE